MASNVRRRGRSRAFVLFALTPLAAGCFSMRPVELSEVSPGDEVVVYLDVETSRRMSAEEGYEVRSVTGRLEPSTGSAIVVSMPVSTPLERRTGGFVVNDIRQLVSLDQPDVVLVERREFNRSRSALVGAALLGSIIWAVMEISGDGGGGPDPGGEPPPPAPSIRFRIPLPF